MMADKNNFVIVGLHANGLPGFVHHVETYDHALKYQASAERVGWPRVAVFDGSGLAVNQPGA